MKIVFLLEEKSTKELLDNLLPRILPEGTDFQTIPHEGKADLRKSLQNKHMKKNRTQGIDGRSAGRQDVCDDGPGIKQVQRMRR